MKIKLIVGLSICIVLIIGFVSYNKNDRDKNIERQQTIETAKAKQLEEERKSTEEKAKVQREQAEVERKKAETERKKAEAEQKAIEEKARIQREQAEAERKRAEAEQKIIEEKARIQREQAEAERDRKCSDKYNSLLVDYQNADVGFWTTSATKKKNIDTLELKAKDIYDTCPKYTSQASDMLYKIRELRN